MTAPWKRAALCGAPLLLSVAVLAGWAPPAGPDATLAGYSADASRMKRDWETQFRAIPDPTRLRESLRRLSARPHNVGTAYDRDNAEWILAQFKSYGLSAQIESF